MLLDSMRSPIGFLLDSYWIPIGEFSQDELVPLRMRRVRSRRAKESRETSQDEFIPWDLAGLIHHASLAGRLGRATSGSREVSEDEGVTRDLAARIHPVRPGRTNSSRESRRTTWSRYE